MACRTDIAVIFRNHQPLSAQTSVLERKKNQPFRIALELERHEIRLSMVRKNSGIHGAEVFPKDSRLLPLVWKMHSAEYRNLVGNIGFRNHVKRIAPAQNMRIGQVIRCPECDPPGRRSIAVDLAISNHAPPQNAVIKLRKKIGRPIIFDQVRIRRPVAPRIFHKRKRCLEIIQQRSLILPLTVCDSPKLKFSHELAPSETNDRTINRKRDVKKQPHPKPVLPVGERRSAE